jgi:hypothetical protein
MDEFVLVFLTFLFNFDAVHDMRYPNKMTMSAMKVGFVKVILGL